MNKSINLLALIKREFKFMFMKNLAKYIVTFILFVGFEFIQAYKISNSVINKGPNFTLEVFGGIDKFVGFEQFKFPLFWFVCNLLIIYIIQDYIQDDLKVNSIYVMSRVGRERYWLVKILVVILNIGIYYFIIFGINYLLGKIYFNSIFRMDYKIITLYITTSIALILFNMCVSLVIDCKYSFLLISSILIFSTVSNIKFLPGQHSLILRHIPYSELEGITIIFSLIYNGVLSIISAVVGMLVIKKKDIR